MSDIAFNLAARLKSVIRAIPMCEILSKVKRELCSLVAELRSLDGCQSGGPLHIVLEDGNLELDVIQSCLQNAKEHWSVSEQECSTNRMNILDLVYQLGGYLVSLPMEDRKSLYDSSWRMS